jgi:hypothetical protein
LSSVVLALIAVALNLDPFLPLLTMMSAEPPITL